jgi:hypothetical protein
VVEEGVCPPLSAVIHGHHHGGGGRGCRAPAKVVAVSSVESPSSCPWRGSEAARPGPERGSGAGRRDAGANGAGSPMVALVLAARRRIASVPSSFLLFVRVEGVVAPAAIQYRVSSARDPGLL